MLHLLLFRQQQQQHIASAFLLDLCVESIKAKIESNHPSHSDSKRNAFDNDTSINSSTVSSRVCFITCENRYWDEEYMNSSELLNQSSSIIENIDMIYVSNLSHLHRVLANFHLLGQPHMLIIDGIEIMQSNSTLTNYSSSSSNSNYQTNQNDPVYFNTFALLRNILEQRSIGQLSIMVSLLSKTGIDNRIEEKLYKTWIDTFLYFAFDDEKSFDSSNNTTSDSVSLSLQVVTGTPKASKLTQTTISSLVNNTTDDKQYENVKVFPTKIIQTKERRSKFVMQWTDLQSIGVLAS